MKKFVPLLLMLILCMSFAVVGCDDREGDGKTTRACWMTLDEVKVFEPVKFHPQIPLKRLSSSDIAFIKSALESEATHNEVEEKFFRIICTDSRWVMTDYTAAKEHTPCFFRYEFAGVEVDISKPVTLELRTRHCPKPSPRALWIPNTDGDPENPSTWGTWEYTDVECKE